MLQSHGSADTTFLTIERLIEKVYSNLPQNEKEKFSIGDIAEILSKLELQMSPLETAAPRLVIQRLIFMGEKLLKDDKQRYPFTYDQTFTTGVNIILIPDNDVGKSSIMKTIKFALTGDDTSYDADVKSWIQKVWLQFSVDNEDFTIFIQAGSKPRGLLTMGKRDDSLDSVARLSGKYFDVVGYVELQSRLQQFFFDRLGLSSFSWTQKDTSTPQGVAERRASWRTFFQALLIPDRSDDYLLCDNQHSMGNQDGLLLSTFLGLHLVEPMNQLGVDRSLLAKQETNKASDIEKMQMDIGEWSHNLENVRQELERIKVARQQRIENVKNQESFRRLPQLSSQMIQLDNERKYLQEKLSNIIAELRRTRQRIRGLGEVIAIKRHFTGLEVLLCPNCDADVGKEAIRHEKESCECRLCGKAASPTSPEDVDELEGQLTYLKEHIRKNEKQKRELENELQNLERRGLILEQERQALQEAVLKLESSIPTADEEAKFAELYGQVGQLSAQISSTQNQLAAIDTSKELTAFQIRVLKKARELLKQQAETMNASVLSRLSAATQTLAAIIGTESITDLSCSALGKITLQKHNTKVLFSSIRNSSERIRVKLAFFLSMMQIGREPGAGRHPGMLLIDQLASSEMVKEDCRALADVLHEIDNDPCNLVQLICFTAEPEFARATVPEKVYGPQSENGYAF